MNLDKSIYSEANISKKPALELLQAMGYTYLSPEECRQQRGSARCGLRRAPCLCRRQRAAQGAGCGAGFPAAAGHRGRHRRGPGQTGA